MRGRFWYPILAVLLLAPAVMGADLYAAPDLEQAIEASCKVSVPMGNGQFASGSGCLYSYENGQGIVVTAAHVVEGGPRDGIILQFGRRSVRVTARLVVAAVRRVRMIGGYRVEVYQPSDIAALAFRVSDWPKDTRLPRPVRFMRKDWRARKGHDLYSLGFPGGVDAPQLLVARVQGYDDDGHMLIYPGPELGRSGSAVVASVEGEPRIVGIVSTRTMEKDQNGRVYLDWRRANGRLVTPAMIWPDGVRPKQVSGTVMVGQPTQCSGGFCPLPGSGGFLLPDREKRIGKIEDQMEKQAGERSPGTVPLPPMAPPVDLGPLDARIAAVEKSLTETINRSNEHSEAIGKLNATAEKAVALAEMVAKRDEAFGKDLASIRAEAAKADQAIAMAADAQGRAENVAGAVADVEDNVAEQLDADNPRSLLGRVRDRIEARVEERIGGLKETLSGMIGLPTFLGGTGLGMGGIALIVAVLALLRRGAIKASQGEETLLQMLAARTPNTYDDVAADVEARVLAAIGNRLPSQRGRTTKTAKASK